MENVSYVTLLLLNFQLIRKCWYTEKPNNPSNVLPQTLDALLSSVSYSYFTCMLRVGDINLPEKATFHLLEHCQYHARDHVVS